MEVTQLQEQLSQLEGHFERKYPALYSRLNAGLGREEIESMQRDRNLSLTEEIIELYSWHNGTHLDLPKDSDTDNIGYGSYAVTFDSTHVFLPLEAALSFRTHMNPQEMYFKTGLLSPDEWRGFVSPFVAADFLERWGAGSLKCPCLASPRETLPLIFEEFAEFPCFIADSMLGYIRHLNFLFKHDQLGADSDNPNSLRSSGNLNRKEIRNINPRRDQLNAVIYELDDNDQRDSP